MCVLFVFFVVQLFFLSGFFVGRVLFVVVICVSVVVYFFSQFLNFFLNLLYVWGWLPFIYSLRCSRGIYFPSKTSGFLVLRGPTPLMFGICLWGEGLGSCVFAHFFLLPGGLTPSGSIPTHNWQNRFKINL